MLKGFERAKNIYEIVYRRKYRHNERKGRDFEFELVYYQQANETRNAIDERKNEGRADAASAFLLVSAVKEEREAEKNNGG